MTRRRTALLLLTGLLTVYLATATYDFVQITDTRATAISAWSLAERGELALPDAWEDVPWRSVTVDGETVTNRFPGAVFWTAPFYLAYPASPDPARAFDVPYGPAGVAAAVATAAAMGVMFLTLDGVVRRRTAVGAVLLLALATGTWSVSADAAWTHGPAQLALALGLLGLQRGRVGWAGLAFGAAMVCRPQLGVVAAVVGLWLGASRRSVAPVLRVAATSAVGLALLLWYSYSLFGRWSPIAGYSGEQLTHLGSVATNVGATDAEGGLVALVSNLGSALFDLRRGVFVYSPFLVVLLPGLRRAWAATSDWVRGAAVAGLVAFLVQLASNPAWWGGDDFFGYRLPLEMLTLATPLLAVAGESWVLGRRWPTRLLAITGAASVVMFALGSTVMDPRTVDEPAFRRYVAELGPHGEGFDPGTAVGYDATAD